MKKSNIDLSIEKKDGSDIRKYKSLIGYYTSISLDANNEIPILPYSEFKIDHSKVNKSVIRQIERLLADNNIREL